MGKPKHIISFVLVLMLLCSIPATGMVYADSAKNSIAVLNSELASFKQGGNYVTYGHYEQDNNTANGTEAIEWIVFDYDAAKNRVLLISRYGLDARAYQPGRNSTKYPTWGNSDIRSWLNGEFLNAAFTAEQQGIAKVVISTASFKGNGGIGSYNLVNNTNGAVRPAFWLDLDSYYTAINSDKDTSSETAEEEPVESGTAVSNSIDTPELFCNRMKATCAAKGDNYYIVLDDSQNVDARLIFADQEFYGGVIYFIKDGEGISFSEYSSAEFDELLVALKLKYVRVFPAMVTITIMAADSKLTYSEAWELMKKATGNMGETITVDNISCTYLTNGEEYWFNIKIASE